MVRPNSGGFFITQVSIIARVPRRQLVQNPMPAPIVTRNRPREKEHIPPRRTPCNPRPQYSEHCHKQCPVLSLRRELHHRCGDDGIVVRGTAIPERQELTSYLAAEYASYRYSHQRCGGNWPLPTCRKSHFSGEQAKGGSEIRRIWVSQNGPQQLESVRRR